MQNKILNLLKKLRKHDCDYKKVRIGSAYDGGYVMPDDLENIKAVLSLGISTNVSFDDYFANRGIDVFQYDPEMNGPPHEDKFFHFRKEALGPHDSEDPISQQVIGSEGNLINVTSFTKKLSTMVEENGLLGNSDLILKMDVEAAEYPSFQTLRYQDLLGFRIITAEIHNLTLLHQESFFDSATHFIDMLTRNRTCIHLHANNSCKVLLIHGVPVPEVIEATFLRNDRSEFSISNEPIPSSLDYPNDKDKDDLVLTAFS